MTFGASPIAGWARAATPPPKLLVSEWSEKFRILPEASASRGGRWRNATCPFLVGIMDAVHEPGVTQISVQKAAQMGVSECLNNILAFFIEHAPSPMLLIQPTSGAAEAYSKERLSDLIRSTPQLRRVVQDKRVLGPDGRPESTLSLKLFPGGFLALGGANSPTAFARWSVRVAIADDCDRFPSVVGDEGDPGRLLINRTASFADPLVIFVSTPVLARGRICSLYDQSDQRHYIVTCPACGRQDWITWSDPLHFHVAWDARTPATARIACVCGHRIDEPARRALIAAGRWSPTATPIAPGVVGFHLPAMYSTFITTEQLVAKFLSSHQEGPMRLKEFICTQLAEGWEDPRERLDPGTLMARAEDF